MNQHKHYKIIDSSEDYTLLSKINNMIEEGWIPAGGICYTGHRYVQAMWYPPVPKESIQSFDKIKESKAIQK